MIKEKIAQGCLVKMEEIRFILKYVYGLLAKTEEVWTRLSDPECKEGRNDYMMRYYYWPLMGVGCLLIFLLHGNGVMLHTKMTAFEASFSLEYAMKGMASFALGYAAGPILAGIIIKELYGRATNEQLDKNQLEIFVHYSMSIVMIFEMFCACLPYFTFLSFIGLYVIYIVYLGTSTYLKVQVSRGLFVTIAFLAIYFSPSALQFLLELFEK